MNASAPSLARDPPVLDVDLYAPEVIADPWPVLERIRQAGPLVWNSRGYWMTARDRVCRHILNRPGPLGAEPVISAFFGADAFIAIDDKVRHNALRNVWAVAFRRDMIQPLARLVAKLADDMLDPLEERLRAGESVDLMAGLCRHLPAFVIAEMLGVPREMQASVVAWSDLMAASTAGGFDIDFATDPAWLAGERAKRELADFLYAEIAHRRAHPGDDLISQIVHSEVGASLSPEAIMINTRQLLFAGNETSAKWLGHIAVVLGRDGDARRAVMADPTLLPAACEEVMRWEPVVHSLPRNVHGDDVEVGGVTLPDGAPVVLLTGGANRDPERYEDPERFDLRREAKANLGFGYGLHSCLGVTLARLEAVETVARLLDRLPDYAIAEDVRYSGFNLRGPDPLPIALA